jgi:hypothetical protein
MDVDVVVVLMGLEWGSVVGVGVLMEEEAYLMAGGLYLAFHETSI